MLKYYIEKDYKFSNELRYMMHRWNEGHNLHRLNRWFRSGPLTRLGFMDDEAW